MNRFILIQLGAWLASKAIQQARESGVRQAAANLRKQGVPCELALLVLRRVKQ